MAKREARKREIRIRKIKNRILAFFLMAVMLTVVAAGTAMGYMSLNKYEDMKAVVNYDKIYDNVYVNGENVGGLTEEEALEIVGGKPQMDLSIKEITLVGRKSEYVFRFEEFGASYDFKSAVEKACAYAREGSLTDRYEMIMALKANPYEVFDDPSYTFDQSDILSRIESIAKDEYEPPVDASVVREGSEFRITPEKNGFMMDVEAAVREFREMLVENRGGRINAVFITIEPQYFMADLEKTNSLIGSFTTKFSQGNTGRNTNIANAAGKINETMIYPDEVFSTNACFGPTTAANGYASAATYVGGRLVDDFGGGVCQVSSTLYNAVLYAELPVVERQNHSMKVGYVEIGFDATLAGTYIDFKFMNDTQYPLFLETTVANGEITVNIYGYEVHPEGRSLKFTSVLLGVDQPPEELIIEDPELPLDERVVEKDAITGYRYDSYKIVYMDGVEIGREKIASSRYRAYRAEVRVGTGGAAPEGEEGENGENFPEGSIPNDFNNAVINGENTENTDLPGTIEVYEPTARNQNREDGGQSSGPDGDHEAPTFDFPVIYE